MWSLCFAILSIRAVSLGPFLYAKSLIFQHLNARKHLLNISEEYRGLHVAAICICVSGLKERLLWSSERIVSERDPGKIRHAPRRTLFPLGYHKSFGRSRLLEAFAWSLVLRQRSSTTFNMKTWDLQTIALSTSKGQKNLKCLDWESNSFGN